MNQRIERLLNANAAAVASFEEMARAVSVDAWHLPIAPHKWTPAQHTEHVARAYAAFVLDLEQDAPMRLLGTARQRRRWRLMGLNLVRWFGRIPSGAPAPRELLPSADASRDVSQQLAELNERVRAFEMAVRTALANPSSAVAHPYFGSLNMHDAVRLAAAHTRHHARALRRVAPIA